MSLRKETGVIEKHSCSYFHMIVRMTKDVRIIFKLWTSLDENIDKLHS